MKNKNRIIIFPTDTVYGMGCSIYDKESLNQIYNIKKRPLNKPIIILFSSLEQIKQIGIINEKVKKISNFFWPGPLTLIINSHKKHYQKTQEKKIGIRIPNHLLALKILKQKGPMRTTSVNISGEKPLNNYFQIVKEYHNKVNYIYDNDEYISCLNSTIIDITTPNLSLIREGEIPFKTIKKIIS
ncbi:MAG: L-threonylcarbamoyladenylate synthase [Candidatus Phytoplasma stylosanthis]|nr:L-threonylcarbamoyladenylate synthase [Candidatus Phytoplasma stylosanthis]